MGVALWKRAEAVPVAAPELPPVTGRCLYRIEVFGEPRAPWRGTVAEAMADAIRLELASWDDELQQHYLAVPVDLRTLYLDQRKRWRS